jgi:predicted nucleic acid-binding protein
MAGFLPDTSCMVASVCTWHEHHAPAAAELNRRLAQREPMAVAAPALVEAYAVLTRLPPPHRLSAADALALLDANFMRTGKAVALDAAAYRTLLHQMVKQGIVGGRTYDAVIARCALRAKASCLLTFNAPHFLAFATEGLEVVVPSLAPAST